MGSIDIRRDATFLEAKSSASLEIVLQTVALIIIDVFTVSGIYYCLFALFRL